MYYRRRVSNLKTEIAQVQYIKDPQSFPDRHNFDNPVYGFQGPDSTRLLNNLRNNSKMNNLNLGATSNSSDFYTDDNSNASGKGNFIC